MLKLDIPRIAFIDQNFVVQSYLRNNFANLVNEQLSLHICLENKTVSTTSIENQSYISFTNDITDDHIDKLNESLKILFV